MVESESLKMLINENSLLLLGNNWDGMGWETHVGHWDGNWGTMFWYETLGLGWCSWYSLRLDGLQKTRWALGWKLGENVLALGLG